MCCYSSALLPPHRVPGASGRPVSQSSRCWSAPAHRLTCHHPHVEQAALALLLFPSSLRDSMRCRQGRPHAPSPLQAVRPQTLDSPRPRTTQALFSLTPAAPSLRRSALPRHHLPHTRRSQVVDDLPRCRRASSMIYSASCCAQAADMAHVRPLALVDESAPEVFGIGSTVFDVWCNSCVGTGACVWYCRSCSV